MHYIYNTTIITKRLNNTVFIESTAVGKLVNCSLTYTQESGSLYHCNWSTVSCFHLFLFHFFFAINLLQYIFNSYFFLI